MSGYTSIVDATPPFLPGTFDGQDVRLATMGNMRPGLFASGDFAVTERGAGANMSVDIAAGRAFVEPGDVARQGTYTAWMGSTYNTSSDGGYSWTAADATNPRIDLVCIDLRDTDFSGAYTGFKFRVIDGTPSASATHQLATTYWPAIPTGCVPLAAIKIPAADTTISTTDITNLNPIGGVRQPYIKNSTAETTTSATYARLATPDFVCVYVPHANCRVRVFSEGWWKISVASGTQGMTLFLNDTQLKGRNTTNAAPAVGSFELTSLSTFYGRFMTTNNGSSAATALFYTGVAGATADVSDITTGLAANIDAGAGRNNNCLEIDQLAAGWYVIEQRYKTSANTLTVDERRMWAEVIG